jgi:hypothetical protein
MVLGRDLAAAVGALLIVVAGLERDRHRRRPPADPQPAHPRTVAVVVDAAFHFVADQFDSYEPRDRILAAQAPIQLILQIVVGWRSSSSAFALLLWPSMGTPACPAPSNWPAPRCAPWGTWHPTVALPRDWPTSPPSSVWARWPCRSATFPPSTPPSTGAKGS